MSLFGKNKKGESIQNAKTEASSLPSLPELPELPELPSLDEEDKTIHQLPSFPSNSFGERFSRNAIKEAVSGKNEEFQGYEKMRKPLTREIPSDFRAPQKSMARVVPEEFREAATRVREEPIFIRIDKFEESLKTFEKIKDKIMEMDKMLRDTKNIKEEEEKELNSWEEEVQKIKGQIEKINRDIFSKVG